MRIFMPCTRFPRWRGFVLPSWCCLYTSLHVLLVVRSSLHDVDASSLQRGISLELGDATGMLSRIMRYIVSRIPYPHTLFYKNLFCFVENRLEAWHPDSKLLLPTMQQYGRGHGCCEVMITHNHYCGQCYCSTSCSTSRSNNFNLCLGMICRFQALQQQAGQHIPASASPFHQRETTAAHHKQWSTRNSSTRLHSQSRNSSTRLHSQSVQIANSQCPRITAFQLLILPCLRCQLGNSLGTYHTWCKTDCLAWSPHAEHQELWAGRCNPTGHHGTSGSHLGENALWWKSSGLWRKHAPNPARGQDKQ